MDSVGEGGKKKKKKKEYINMPEKKRKQNPSKNPL